MEYFNKGQDILFESKDLQNYDQTINLFNLFLFEDNAIINATNWVDSGIEVKNISKGSSFKHKLIWFVIFFIAIYIYKKL